MTDATILLVSQGFAIKPCVKARWCDEAKLTIAMKSKNMMAGEGGRKKKQAARNMDKMATKTSGGRAGETAKHCVLISSTFDQGPRSSIDGNFAGRRV